MSLRTKQQYETKGGALVVVTGPSIAEDCGEFEAPHCCSFDNQGRRGTTPRSAFLVQLARQYESAKSGATRRKEARHRARRCYGQQSAKADARHLVWA